MSLTLVSCCQTTVPPSRTHEQISPWDGVSCFLRAPWSSSNEATDCRGVALTLLNPTGPEEVVNLPCFEAFPEFFGRDPSLERPTTTERSSSLCQCHRDHSFPSQGEDPLRSLTLSTLHCRGRSGDSGPRCGWNPLLGDPETCPLTLKLPLSTSTGGRSNLGRRREL